MGIPVLVKPPDAKTLGTFSTHNWDKPGEVPGTTIALTEMADSPRTLRFRVSALTLELSRRGMFPYVCCYCCIQAASASAENLKKARYKTTQL